MWVMVALKWLMVVDRPFDSVTNAELRSSDDSWMTVIRWNERGLVVIGASAGKSEDFERWMDALNQGCSLPCLTVLDSVVVSGSSDTPFEDATENLKGPNGLASSR